MNRVYERFVVSGITEAVAFDASIGGKAYAEQLVNSWTKLSDEQFASAANALTLEQVRTGIEQCQAVAKELSRRAAAAIDLEERLRAWTHDAAEYRVARQGKQ